MKRFWALAAVATLVVTSCVTDHHNDPAGPNDQDGPIEDGVVMVNGSRWATRNVGESGEFVEKPEDFGGYFTLAEARGACPAGWRLPTVAEFTGITSVDTNEWMVVDGVAGTRFGSTEYANPGLIFLPAAGERSADGTVVEAGEKGVYWTYSGDYLLLMEGFFSLDGEITPAACSVRCIDENSGIIE